MDRSLSLDNADDLFVDFPGNPFAQARETGFVSQEVQLGLEGCLQLGCVGLRWEAGVVWAANVVGDSDSKTSERGVVKIAQYQHPKLQFTLPDTPIIPNLILEAFRDNEIHYGNLHRQTKFKSSSNFLRFLIVPITISKNLVRRSERASCVMVYYSVRPELVKFKKETSLEAMHSTQRTRIHEAETPQGREAVQCAEDIQEMCAKYLINEVTKDTSPMDKFKKMPRWPRPMTCRSYFEKYFGYPQNTFKIRKYSLSELIWTFIGAFIAMGFVAYFHYWYFVGEDMTLVLASMGATSVLSFGFVESPLGQPRNALLGHAVSALAGVAVVQLINVGCPYWVACCLATAFSILGMQVFGCVHPPGAATAMAFVTRPELHHLGFLYILIPAVTGVSIITIVAVVWNNLSRSRHYPIQWWSEHSDQDSKANVAALPEVYSSDSTESSEFLLTSWWKK